MTRTGWRGTGWLVLALGLGPASLGAQLRRAEYTELHMGMAVRVVLYADSDSLARRAARAAFDRIATLEDILSDWRPHSEVRRLAAAAPAWGRVSPELFDVLARAHAVAERTGGAFDPTVGPLVALWRRARRDSVFPDSASLTAALALTGWRALELDSATRSVRLAAAGMQLDLGGIAKGWILEDAKRVLAGLGITRVLLEAGGDIVTGAAPPDESGWAIATAAGTLRLHDRAIATSGDAAQFVVLGGHRWSHVVDPRSGWALRDSRAVTVTAADGATADALATALGVTGGVLPGGLPPGVDLVALMPAAAPGP